jgi:hypothetical protein
VYSTFPPNNLDNDDDDNDDDNDGNNDGDIYIYTYMYIYIYKINTLGFVSAEGLGGDPLNN